MSLQIVVEGSGIEQALKALDPKNVDKALIRWYAKGTSFVKFSLKSRTPARLRGKVKIKTDGYTPPRWARIWVKSPLAHLLEGGTGMLGDPSFNHRGRFFPRIGNRPGYAGVMQATGLPAPQAFLVARTIFLRGGMPPQPFIRVTFDATQGQLVKMATDAVNEVLAE